MLRVAGHRVAGVLERAQLHLGLEGVRRELAAIAGVLKIGALAEQIVGVPEGPFGLNNVPILVSSDSDRSRISRQSRSDRGPLGTQPSFDQLRNEPELA